MAESKKGKQDNTCETCGKSFASNNQLIQHMKEKCGQEEMNTVQQLDPSIEKQITTMGRAMAEKLKTYPQEKVMIPIDKLNKGVTDVVVGMNGFNIQIKRGVPVMLPIPVVDLLIQARYNPTIVR